MKPDAAFAVLGLCICSASLADDPPITDKPETVAEVTATFAALDRNDDGVISKEEAAREASLSKRFAAVDTDADGKITEEEFRARPSDEEFE